MKKFFIFLIIIAVLGVSGWYGWKYLKKISKTKQREEFVWGITARPSALGGYGIKKWRQQLSFAEELGSIYIRLGWDYKGVYRGYSDPFKFHDHVISEIEKKGLSTYLGFEGDPDIISVKDPYYDGYSNAFHIASKFKGRIKYYQVANEISSVAIKGAEFPGNKEDQFDPEKYVKVRDWVKGASKGIREADPDAKIVLTGQWTQYAFFDMLARDSVDYDVIGWNWFSGMGLISENKLEDGTGILDHLQKFNKPIFLVEVGQESKLPDGTQHMDEDKQAEFIKEMAEWSYNSGIIKGFIAFELTDNFTLVNIDNGKDVVRSGLIEVQKEGRNNFSLTKRKAFDVYKEIIGKYSK